MRFIFVSVDWLIDEIIVFRKSMNNRRKINVSLFRTADFSLKAIVGSFFLQLVKQSSITINTYLIIQFFVSKVQNMDADDKIGCHKMEKRFDYRTSHFLIV